MRTITISQLRRISDLTMELPSGNGVYLLTGANGAGKSTLLSVMAQIGDRGALAHFFQPNITFRDEENILSQSMIRYAADEQQFVEYRFRNDAWTVTEGDADAAFSAFGFAETLFAGARPKRQPIAGEVFDRSAIRPAPEPICEAVASIFDDEDFRKLAVITSPATGKDVFLRPIELNGKQYIFSENNFSAGERAVIQLAHQLMRIARDSLVLIDEAEMALHPKAQKRLIYYLERAAKLKNLLIIVSTQSASLIKITDPAHILFLEDDEALGRMVCRRNTYPAAILGEMAFAEEILPETILLVEDPEAAMLLEAIVSKLKVLMPETDFPYTKILPVGGYMQVIILMDNLSKVFPPYVHRRAVLDKDAEYSVRRTASDANRSQHSVVSRNMDRIYFLPCAPEQGVVRLLEDDPAYHTKNLRKLFYADAINLRDLMRGNDRYRMVPGDSRSDCKDKLSLITAYLSAVTAEPEMLVRKKLYHYYVDKHYRDPYRLKSEYCPLIFRKI